MAAPVLLVADDLSTIASVRRLLAREGYEVILATSAADALIAFGHHLPSVVLLHPPVESERGQVVLEELQGHPDGALAHVLLLGETVPGFAWPVVPLPPDADTFLPLLQDAMRGGSEGEHWTVRETSPRAAPPVAPVSFTPEPWRATVPAREASPPLGEDELSRLEAEVRAEAALRRRRSQDLTGASAQDPDPSFAAVPEAGEESFAQAPAASPSGDEQFSPFEEGAPPDDLAQLAREREEAVGREQALATEAAAADARLDAQRAGAGAQASRTRATLERAIGIGAAARVQAQEQARARTQELEDLAQAAQRATEERDLERAESQKTLATLERLRGELADERGRVGEARVRAERERYDALLKEKDAALETAERDLEAARDEAMRRGQDGAAAHEELKKMNRAMEGELERVKRERDAARQDLARAGELEPQLDAARMALQTHEAQQLAERLRAQEALGRIADDKAALQRQLADAEVALAAEQQRAELEVARRGETEKSLGSALSRSEALETRAFELEARAGEALETNARLTQELEALKAAWQLEGSRHQESRAQLAQSLADEQARAAAQLEAVREDLRRLEARATAAEAHAQALEEKIALPVKVAGRSALMVPRAGTVERARLAELVCQLVAGRNDVRLELGTQDGVRTLWLARGALVAAESQAPGESLIERARRDGLIDARQEAELRMLRLASPREVLELLRARGYLRQAESAPLVQRYVEQVALDALSEAQVGYRLSEEVHGPEVLAAEAPRPLLPLLAEALRRGLAPDALLELLGGGEAVPVSRESALDLRQLGFTEKERKLLGYVDGQATVEELSMVAGLKPEAAFRALVVARDLGLLAVRVPVGQTAPLDPELDARRLLAKYEEVQEADYFTILGLGKHAGTDEVQRSFERLSREFDPIRFSGHPDARLQQQAQAVHRLLEEAAKALEDERRRSEYARHLLD